ncbi:20S proteasome alpha-type subunit [Gordonia hirsuta DSM 44140 = NBRC 16056]|uniref:20S proteasome alpha-type subunit n=1 Tax=Gordonia hirsuta DSM 44140 = NBRC 16056 TaxID=1121927 RepID=L7L4N2_9ACTN|nr:proteasome subunit alpha [Gordonia hirsuta]GAC56100.1 20S proteasome alpha-type subunit [Gordonia hirsuta DSM 44140 = NBRC 16056]
MTFPYYASAEQIMRDRSELARKGIARGRSVVALTYGQAEAGHDGSGSVGESAGVLFVAHNPSNTLRKVSEIYDRIGFAAVGKYNEFESLRRAGIQLADLRGYSYDRADVTGLSLATAYATTLGTVFTEQPKPYEVELCVAEVAQPGRDTPSQLYRIGYDGSISDESAFLVMGGTTEPIVAAMTTGYRPAMTLAQALAVAVEALSATGDGAKSDTADAAQNADKAAAGSRLTADQLEVAVLDRRRPRRAFERLSTARIVEILEQE